MGISIRTAVMEDSKTINELTHQLGYPISEKESINNLSIILKNPEEAVFLAVDSEKVVGWIHVFHTVRLESGSFSELGGLVVDENCRGKGIGNRLIEKVKEWCKSKGIISLRLRSNVIRIRAHQFYFRLGFKELKEQKVLEIILDRGF